MPTRRTIVSGLSIATGAILAGCGTIIYPDRVDQTTRKDLDPVVVILNGVGLLFFLVPGVVAFAVDFATGAIYLPEGRDDKERTIFDEISLNTDTGKTLKQEDIEHAVGQHIGQRIDLSRPDVKAERLENLDQFWLAQNTFAGTTLWAAN